MKTFNGRHRLGEGEDLERLSRDTLNAATLNEAEIDEIAGASDLYERIQRRIVAKRTAQSVARAEWWGAAWRDSSVLPESSGLRRRPRLVFAIAFVVLLLFVMVMPRQLRTTPDAPQPQATGEIATDYIPLTWVTDATAMDSGQVVRVKVPRAMLLSIGVATNTAGAGEFVLADVVVSDDGLARAIRLVNR